MTPFYLDVETIPDQRPGVRAAVEAAMRPPGNYKKAETIAEWEKNERPKLAEEAWLKTSFDGGAGELILIGFARGDDSIEVVRRSPDERSLIEEAFDLMDATLRPEDNGRIRVVGHRVADFDLRFIWQRAVIHGIKPPDWLPFHAKPWDLSVFDTMYAWAGPGRFVSLDTICTALGVARKGTEIGEDIDGSKVWEFYRAGRLDELEVYCGGDVSRVREIYKRMIFAPTAFST
jgi:hypothetical protein